jgi:hypothetical protein
MGERAKECRFCKGSGLIVLLNSWFRDDLRRERCYYCRGSGRCAERPLARDMRKQAELRARWEELRRSRVG